MHGNVQSVIKKLWAGNKYETSIFRLSTCFAIYPFTICL